MNSTTATITAVHLALLKAGAMAADHASSMFDSIASGDPDGIICDAIDVAQAASVALNAAVTVANLTEYRIAVGMWTRIRLPEAAPIGPDR